MRPLHTRLRWVKAKNEATLEKFLRTLSFRVEIKEIIWKDKEQTFVMFFVPPDESQKDIQSGTLKG